MNTFSQPTFQRPTTFLPGEQPNYCAAFTLPSDVTVQGTVTVVDLQHPVIDPDTLLSEGLYPSGTIQWGTVATPGVYQGTGKAAFWGFDVPLGWTGVVECKIQEQSGTMRPVPNTYSLTDANGNIAGLGFVVTS